jgi:DME family drug/metabolite transporter
VHRRAALVVTALAAVLWGTSFPANKFGLGATDAWTFLPLRFGLAFAAAAALAMALGGFDASWARNKWLWFTAAANVASYQVQFLGQQLTTPGAASLMVNAGNLAVPLFAWMVHGERVRGVKAPALALGALGVALVGTGGDLASLAGSAFVGNVLALAAGLSFALVIVLNKAAVGSEATHDARGLASLVAWISGLTALLGLPGALLLGHGALPAQAWEAAAYTGLFCTVAAFLLWSLALQHLSSVVSGIVLLLEIVVALGLSVLLGLEGLGLAKLLGAACIIGATLLAGQAPEDPGPAAVGAPAAGD